MRQDMKLETGNSKLGNASISFSPISNFKIPISIQNKSIKEVKLYLSSRAKLPINDLKIKEYQTNLIFITGGLL